MSDFKDLDNEVEIFGLSNAWKAILATPFTFTTKQDVCICMQAVQLQCLHTAAVFLSLIHI